MLTMIVIIMGVSGSGKSTVGEKLSQKIGWKFFEGDNYHPKENIEKMENNIPLTDEDRMLWLLSLRRIIKDAEDKNENIILSCSALKSSYRDILKVNDGVKFIYLKGDYDLIRQRMEYRYNHFMKVNLLQSQFDSLEEPKDALTVSIEKPEEEIVDEITAMIKSES